VSYGESGYYGTSTTYDTSFVTDHMVVIHSLKPNTLYHFQVAGLTEGGGSLYSGDNTFLTLPLPDTPDGGGTGSGGTSSGDGATAPVSSASGVPRGTIPIRTVPVETVAPAVAVSTDLSRPVTTGVKLSGSASDNVAIARVDYSLDGGKNWIVIESPQGLGGKRVSYSFLPTAEDGNYDLVVRATDTSGNMATTKSATLVIDRLPPRMGSELVSFGSQVVAPDSSGRWQAAVDVNQTIVMNAVGGPVTMIVAVTPDGKARPSQNFYMRRDDDSGLWSGVMSFRKAGTYHLTVTAADGGGARVRRTLPDVVVAPAARVVAKSGRILAGAKVSLYYRRPGASTWLLWSGEEYGQENPQRTRADGVFGFLVPKGTYYLKAEAAGYQTLVTRQFSVDRPTPLVPTLSMDTRPTLRLGSWSVALPWVSLTRTAVDAKAPKTVAGGTAGALVGHVLPSFRLPTTSGAIATPVSLTGKPTLVSALATWAPSTAEQLPALAQLGLHDEITVAPLYLGEHTGKVQTALARAGYDLSALVDSSAALTDSLGVPNVPVHYVLDRRGKVVEVISGVTPAERLLASLKAQL
jgi:hypothetical protein